MPGAMKTSLLARLKKIYRIGFKQGLT